MGRLRVWGYKLITAPPTIDPWLSDSARIVAEQLHPPFRGEIWECYADVPMVRGFSNEGKPFDIETACYLKEPMRAIRERPFGKFVIMAAVQMLKTNGCIEQPAGYFIQHDPGDMGIYLSGDDSALDQAKSRLMPYIKSVPGIARIVEETTAANRNDITTAEFYLPGMVLRVWPLNESSTQRITLRYVLISDAFLSKKSGLIKQAIARTTQHNTTSLKDYKIVIESQGGEEGDDFDSEWKSADMRLLHVKCPLCGMGQPFDWDRLRPADFMPLAEMKEGGWQMASGRDKDGEWIFPKHAKPVKPNSQLPTPNSHSGMKRGDEDLIKREDGTYNEQEILRLTYYECFDCGGAWHDTPATRKQLDESSYYVATNPNALPENIGFSWPAWAGQRLAWGGELIMLEYLRAKRAADELGDDESLKQWYQKRAGRPWNPRLNQASVAPIIGSHDFSGMIPNESFRSMQVDCQKDKELSARLGKDVTGHFWVTADAVDKSGNTFELWRGYCTSWEEWIAMGKKLKIPTRNIAIDGSYWFDLIKEMAAKHRTMEDGKDSNGNPCKVWATWKVLRGDDARSFKWEDGQWRSYRVKNETVNIAIETAGQPPKWIAISIPVLDWSNFAIKNQLHISLLGMPGKPKMVACAADKLSAVTRARELEKDFSYESQLNSEVLGEYRGKPKWIPIHKQNHYRDCKCMGIVLKAMKGLVGQIAPPDDEAQRVG